MSQNEASRVTGIKDQAVGAIKETFGTMLGNPKMELQGKAQKIHGKNEYEFAKAYNSGETEPEKFKQAYRTTSENEEEIPDEFKTSKAAGMKDSAVGAMKETIGSATNNQKMEIEGKAQNIRGHNEIAFAEAQKEGWREPKHFEQGTKETERAECTVEGTNPSALHSLTERAVGALKENVGAATGNMKMELEGKARRVHGRNEAEFAKAERENLYEPEQFVHGTKATERAEGTVVGGEEPSALWAMKDRAVGAVKEAYGSTWKDFNMELEGRAMRVHGRNEAEFAKARREGLEEPRNFRSCASGEVEGGENASALGGMKDRMVGAVKETFGSTFGNFETELKGKAQRIHGKNEAEFAKASNEGLSEPQHFEKGYGVWEKPEGSVEGENVSTWGAMKDRAVGAVKETYGKTTGDFNAELEGKAQRVHGRNEAEFVKAQREGRNEPQGWESEKPINA